MFIAKPNNFINYAGWSRKTGLAPAAPLLRGNAKVESLSIAVLNDFVIAAPSQAC